MLYAGFVNSEIGLVKLWTKSKPEDIICVVQSEMLKNTSNHNGTPHSVFM